MKNLNKQLVNDVEVSSCSYHDYLSVSVSVDDVIGGTNVHFFCSGNLDESFSFFVFCADGSLNWLRSIVTISDFVDFVNLHKHLSVVSDHCDYVLTMDLPLDLTDSANCINDSCAIDDYDYQCPCNEYAFEFVFDEKLKVGFNLIKETPS